MPFWLLFGQKSQPSPPAGALCHTHHPESPRVAFTLTRSTAPCAHVRAAIRVAPRTAGPARRRQRHSLTRFHFLRPNRLPIIPPCRDGAVPSGGALHHPAPARPPRPPPSRTCSAVPVRAALAHRFLRAWSDFGSAPAQPRLARAAPPLHALTSLAAAAPPPRRRLRVRVRARSRRPWGWAGRRRQLTPFATCSCSLIQLLRCPLQHFQHLLHL